MNYYFRENIRTLKFVGTFFIRHHTTHLTWYEKVIYKGYNEKTDEYEVRKIINKHFMWVKKKNLHLNAK